MIKTNETVATSFSIERIPVWPNKDPNEDSYSQANRTTNK